MERKIRLSMMRKDLTMRMFTLVIIIIAQCGFFTIYIFTQNLVSFYLLFYYVIYYKISQMLILPFYKMYKNVKLEEEFDIRPVTGGMSTNQKS